jgi:pimeloyl-ACP methyl ester carboxylesterase
MLEHHYADLPNGIRLHYACAGAGPLLLFVHGFPEFWYGWKDQLVEFGRDHLAVAPDMRGYNLSSKPAEVEAYRAKRLVEDLRALIDQLGGRPCVLVAHDWGGAVAWSFAARHPDYLRRLVIINAPHPVVFARELRSNPAQRKASAYMNLFRSDKAERVLAENNYARLSRMTLDSWASNGGAAAGSGQYRLHRAGGQVLAAVLLAGRASAVVRNVPADYPSIQACVNAAVAGDTCLVAPGKVIRSGESVDLKPGRPHAHDHGPGGLVQPRRAEIRGELGR